MIRFQSLSVPGPTPTPISKPFWEAAAKSQLILQYCSDCLTWVFYPRAICPHCWNLTLKWREANGKGRVRSFTVIHRPGHPAWEMAVPYAVALIDLAEGPTMLSGLIGIPIHDIAVGMDVQVRFLKVGEWTLPLFETSTDGAT